MVSSKIIAMGLLIIAIYLASYGIWRHEKVFLGCGHWVFDKNSIALGKPKPVDNLEFKFFYPCLYIEFGCRNHSPAFISNGI